MGQSLKFHYGSSDAKLTLTAMVKSIDPDVFMEQAANDYVLAVRVLHAKYGMLVQSL